MPSVDSRHGFFFKSDRTRFEAMLLAGERAKELEVSIKSRTKIGSEKRSYPQVSKLILSWKLIKGIIQEALVPVKLPSPIHWLLHGTGIFSYIFAGMWPFFTFHVGK